MGNTSYSTRSLPCGKGGGRVLCVHVCVGGGWGCGRGGPGGGSAQDRSQGGVAAGQGTRVETRKQLAEGRASVRLTPHIQRERSSGLDKKKETKREGSVAGRSPTWGLFLSAG